MKHLKYSVLWGALLSTPTFAMSATSPLASPTSSHEELDAAFYVGSAKGYENGLFPHNQYPSNSEKKDLSALFKQVNSESFSNDENDKEAFAGVDVVNHLCEKVKQKTQDVTVKITEKGINLEETDHATMKAQLEKIDSALLEENASKLTQQILEEHLESLQTILASL